MKRYNSMTRVGLVESEEGKWVRFSDVVIFTNKIIKESTYLDTTVLHDSIECNCEENFNRCHEPVSYKDPEFDQKSKPWWFCPAHGYKKL